MTSVLYQNSLAATKAIGVENIPFTSPTDVLPRKILLFGYADPTLDGVSYVSGQLYKVASASEVSAKFGYGHEVSRLAEWSYRGSLGVETWVLAATQSGDKAAGSIQVTASGVLAGTLHLFISGEYVPVAVSNNDTAANIEAAIVASINADLTLSVEASTLAPVADAANTIAKDAGVFGNYTKISFNEQYGQEFPVGVSVVVVQPTGGTGGAIPGDANFFDILGLNDEQNENYFTDLSISTPGLSPNVLDPVSRWNGEGNDFVGNYSKTVQRPLRSVNGDTAPGDSGYNSLISVANGRKQDRTNGVVTVPGSPNHPQEIAALAMGIAARINNENPAESYVDELLPEVLPGAPTDRWTSDYTKKDTAVKAGISPTIYDRGAVKLQNLLTFYHPVNVASENNGYRSMRAIAVLQNTTNSVRALFDQESWKRVTIVADVSRVTGLKARLKVKDKRAVENDIISLVRDWGGLSWVYDSDFSINLIKTGEYVAIRAAGTGFDVTIPIVLSGEAWIVDTVVRFDTALTVFTQ